MWDSDDAGARIGMPVVFGVGSLAFVTNIGEGQYPVGSNRDPIASGQHSLAFTGPRGGCEEPPHAIHTGRGGLVTDQQQVCYTIHVNICGTHLGVGQDPVSRSVGSNKHQQLDRHKIEFAISLCE